MGHLKLYPRARGRRGVPSTSHHVPLFSIKSKKKWQNSTKEVKLTRPASLFVRQLSYVFITVAWASFHHFLPILHPVILLWLKRQRVIIALRLTTIGGRCEIEPWRQPPWYIDYTSRSIARFVFSHILALHAGDHYFSVDCHSIHYHDSIHPTTRFLPCTDLPCYKRGQDAVQSGTLHFLQLL